jgi:5-methyltetrahydropteroyltriglutamate--homocysteine methyltransferase
MADDFKYHIDHHSSLIVPAELVEARAAAARGELPAEQLRAVQDRLIREALREQRRLGLAAVSDGQLRRRNALAPVYDAVDGFGAETAVGSGGPVAELLGDRLAPEHRPLVGTPSARDRLARGEAAFVTGALPRPVLVALPSPGFVLALTAPTDGSVGAEAVTALAAIIRDEAAALAAEGVAYVQLHNPLAGVLLTVAGHEHAKALGLDADALLAWMLEADAKVLDGLTAPPEFRIGLDLTTAGCAHTDRGYDAAAVTAFLAGQPFTRLHVEYPADEAARFPLELLKPGTVVSLGIVDVSSPEAEDVDALVERIDRAATVVDIDDIAISTNGPFTASAAALTETQQHAKLQLVEMTARYFWGNEL